MILHRWRPHTGGFTLVELLVVSAIVALLASLLLPALSVAKERSQSIYCVNSLRQMGLISQMYVEDNSGYFPWTFTVEGDQLQSRTWFTYLDTYPRSQRLWLCPVRPKKVSLAPIITAGSFQRSQEGEIVFPSDGTVVNYAANIELGGCFNQAAQFNFPPLKASAVSHPSKTVHISDSGSQAFNTRNGKLCVTPQSAPKHGAWILSDPSNSLLAESSKAATDDPNWCGPQLRHMEKANVLFLEGGVENLPSWKWYYAGTKFELDDR